MIEKIIRNYLATELSTVPVYVGERPADSISEYVVIQVLDSGRINHIDAITLNIYSHSTTLANASILNARVKNAMYDAIKLDEISSSKCGGGGGQTIDTATKSYEYECIFNLYYYDD